MGIEDLNIDHSSEPFDLNYILDNNNRINIVVNKDQFKIILEQVGTKVDSNGLLIDAKTGAKEKSNAENEIKFDNLGVLSAGSKVFIEKNIASFSEFLVARNRNKL